MRELTPTASAPDDATVEELVKQYRDAAGEHPDWDDFRRTMVADGRLVVRLQPGAGLRDAARLISGGDAEAGAHQVDEVVVVEGLAGSLIDAVE